MNSISQESSPVLSALNNHTTKRRRKWRMFKDKLAQYSMTVGGMSVIMAICLIFFYLLYVILPLFSSASIKEITSFSITSEGDTLYLAAEEKSEIGVRFTKNGHVVFFNLKAGKAGNIISDTILPIPENVAITSFGVADKATNVVAFGLSNGQALVVKPVYEISYPNDVRVITPRLSYPLGNEAIIVDEAERALVHLDVQLGEEDNTLVAVTDDFRLLVVQATKEGSFLDEEDEEDEEIEFEYIRGELSLSFAAGNEVTHLLLDKEQRIVYLADNDGQISRFDVSDKSQPQLIQRIHVVNSDKKITSVTFLTGDISLLIGDSEGGITQWFPVRDKNNNTVLTKIREFHEQSAAIVGIASEERRKGFVAIDSSGKLGIYHSTAHRTLKIESIANKNTLSKIAITPRADTLLIEDNQANLHIWAVHNEHPEVSMSALWGKVWYESYEKPDYVWQSSSASSDFEPKFSLTPLAYGTFKAAFYAMLIAIPLAIFGAIYTAYFMAPKMRSIVKPSIEIMAALPTVILGFIAGLWLAPFLEKNLLGFFTALLLLPISVFIFGYISRFWFKFRSVDGWQSALLIPVIILVTWFSFAISQPLELFLFNGNLPAWMTTEFGINFDQRNALIVGIAMGLAVIPTIFSMTEDAIFGVPKHLTIGSLALGATPWQTMIKVVLLTASPGIFSAIMIGMGRAVGETMIVLMATGNTPIMDFNIFEGLRTLSANLAVEMPETEVASTHYRVLFLAGFVLFVFTFVINTVAEVVRHRLRKKYSSL